MRGVPGFIDAATLAPPADRSTSPLAQSGPERSCDAMKTTVPLSNSAAGFHSSHARRLAAEYHNDPAGSLGDEKPLYV
jgi:hypothetical protein